MSLLAINLRMLFSDTPRISAASLSLYDRRGSCFAVVAFAVCSNVSFHFSFAFVPARGFRGQVLFPPRGLVVERFSGQCLWG